MEILKIQQMLLEKNIKIFTTTEFRRITGLSPIASQKILERYTKKGVFIRAIKGIYLCSFNKPLEWAIANRIVKPSYISYETALSYYGIIPETVYIITSATIKKPKETEVNNLTFLYHHIGKNAFTGYIPLEKNSEVILMAEVEKALCDYLFLIFLNKKKLNDRLNLKNISLRKLLIFAKLFNSRGFINWVRNVIRRNN